MKKLIICVTCGAEKVADWRENRQAKFCSRKCIRNSTQFKKGQAMRLGKKPPQYAWDNPRSKKTRFGVGHSFGFTKGFIPWNKGLQYGVGERFRGRIMNLSIYRNWRLEVKKRDGGKCTDCFATDNLEIDHYPKTFAQIIIENNVKTVDEARECIDLWQVENGRTLCHLCHTKTPTYGRMV